MTVRLGMSAKKAPTDASDSRLDFRNGFVRNSDNTLRTGITSPVAAGLQLVTATADTGTMTVAVAALDAVANRDGGVVQLCNDGVIKPTIAAAPPSGQRLDVVYVMQHDSSTGVVTPDADDLANVYVATGNVVATGQPTKPSIPAAATEIATVYMPSGVTSTLGNGVVITQTFQYTAAAGASVPFPSASALLLWTTAQDGQRAHVINGPSYERVLGAWVRSAPVVQHAEYLFTRSGIGDNGDASGTINIFSTALDATPTTDTAFTTMSTPTGNTITFNEAGVYDVSIFAQVAAAPTGKFWVQIIVPGSSPNANGVVARYFQASGENTGSTSIPNLRVAAGATVRFEVGKTTGSAADVSTRIRVTKVGR